MGPWSFDAIAKLQAPSAVHAPGAQLHLEYNEFVLCPLYFLIAEWAGAFDAVANVVSSAVYASGVQSNSEARFLPLRFDELFWF